MKSIIGMFVIAFAATVGTAYAANDKPADGKKMGSQQTKMKACNQEAGEKGLKGTERKTFMSGCLKSNKQ